VTDKKKLYSWGCNTHSALGRGEHVPEPLIPDEIPLSSNCLAVHCGYFHNYVETEDGVYSFGWNDDGKLGLGDFNNRVRPTKITFFENKKIHILRAGGHHALCMTSDGKIYSWVKVSYQC
jgi:alpha-tubulin suppressor-like RCC1 family protein